MMAKPANRRTASACSSTSRSNALTYHLSDVETAASLALLAAAPGLDLVPGSLGLLPLTEPYTDRLGTTSFRVSAAGAGVPGRGSAAIPEPHPGNRPR